MESEINRKNDILHPRTLVIHQDFEELRDFILSLQNVLKEMKVLLFIKGVMN